MNEAVLDASVVLKWFRPEGERNLVAAQALRERYEAGELRVLAPPLLWLEVINVAARSWRWPEAQLGRLASMLPTLRFELVEPEAAFVAQWACKGLSAYDAAYVAVARETGLQLVTDDAEIVRTAPQFAVALDG